MKKIIAVAAVVVAGLGLTACDTEGKISEPFNDAPRGVTNDKPADVVTMPDGFSNLASKCDGPNRVYVIFYPYGSVAVAPNDPRCAK